MVNPLFGTILISLALTVLLPSIFFLMIPESPDTTKMKEQEKLLLRDGAKLIKPELIFADEDQAQNTELSVAC